MKRNAVYYLDDYDNEDILPEEWTAMKLINRINSIIYSYDDLKVYKKGQPGQLYILTSINDNHCFTYEDIFECIKVLCSVYTILKCLNLEDTHPE